MREPRAETGPRGARAAAVGVALVTGASSGIGAAVSRRLAGDGWDLLVAGRQRDRLEAVARETSAATLYGDLAAPGGARELAARALTVAPSVHLLVAAAGVGWAGPFTSMPNDAIDEVIGVDLTAVIHLVRGVVPRMVEQRRGQIVLIGSFAGCVGVRDEAVYSAAKAGLGAFADALRYELTGTGVRVTHIVPGVVDTPFFARRGVPYVRQTPRPIPPEQVADVVARAVRGRCPDEVFLPRWLRFPVAIRGLAPFPFRRLSSRFG
ncbi:SDR family NAD(P)-dependent oxidoreductase [Streptomyces sp. PLK6-54]|uniref:SDR family NAD(P)-dependent oxidoreductase n=2 Tax=Actinacidiphila acidipaludis TaxID=2873382 RepID=A0ABS7Q974_9ACTN|nr:SDR family NAD(P)-dependent oxidoreductase [Streptomyces acidipaludis]MBY8879700.1 SDR family NAD(P)-dependent oxidoreductase [Streptomyces acidipaludis]